MTGSEFENITSEWIGFDRFAITTKVKYRHLFPLRRGGGGGGGWEGGGVGTLKYGVLLLFKF